MRYEEILQIPPFSLSREEKEKQMRERLTELTEFHASHCSAYQNFIRTGGYNEKEVSGIKDIPFFPVRLFKDMELKSVPEKEVFKTMTSSGTTGQSVSKIFLDRRTAANQQKTLVKIVADFTGAARLPMLIIDTPSVIKDRRMFSARGAGILGFSIFGSDKTYALDENMNLNRKEIDAFLSRHSGEPILLFGFTFMIWQHFYQALVKESDRLDLSNGILIHGGGWKKLLNEAVSKETFHSCFERLCGLRRIHDYYGMVEQTGCIYMECECGHLHASIFSDIIIRRGDDFSVAGIGEPGIIQVVSMLPESYPGHSILTEDIGILLGEDDCPCGRKGKYFSVQGRMKNAEVRGCSDTYERKQD